MHIFLALIFYVVNLMKITPIKYWMCGASNNQASKTKCMKVIITNKSRKQREKRREKTHELCLPVRSKTD